MIALNYQNWHICHAKKPCAGYLGHPFGKDALYGMCIHFFISPLLIASWREAYNRKTSTSRSFLGNKYSSKGEMYAMKRMPYRILCNGT